MKHYFIRKACKMAYELIACRLQKRIRECTFSKRIEGNTNFHRSCKTPSPCEARRLLGELRRSTCVAHDAAASRDS